MCIFLVFLGSLCRAHNKVLAFSEALQILGVFVKIPHDSTPSLIVHVGVGMEFLSSRCVWRMRFDRCDCAYYQLLVRGCHVIALCSLIDNRAYNVIGNVTAFGDISCPIHRFAGNANALELTMNYY